jgi:hypothetical protein
MNRSLVLILFAILICGCIGGAPPEEPVDNTVQPQEVVQPTVDPYELLTIPLNSLRSSVEILVEDLNNYFDMVEEASRYGNWTVYNRTVNISVLQSDYNDVLARDLERINSSLDAMEQTLRLIYGVPMELINTITRSVEQMRDDLQLISEDLNINLNQFVEKYPMIARAISLIQKDLASIDSAVNQLRGITPRQIS